VNAGEGLHPPFHVFPNPVRDMLIVEGLENGHRKSVVTLMNVSGEVIHLKEYETDATWHLNVSHLQTGVYFMKIITSDKTYFSRFVKE
jgi:hypothetical protein